MPTTVMPQPTSALKPYGASDAGSRKMPDADRVAHHECRAHPEAELPAGVRRSCGVSLAHPPSPAETYACIDGAPFVKLEQPHCRVRPAAGASHESFAPCIDVRPARHLPRRRRHDGRRRTKGTRPRRALRGDTRAVERNHRRFRRDGRAGHAHRGPRRRPQGAHRRHRHPAARPAVAEQSRLRWVVRAERQWRNDGHDLPGRNGPDRRADHAHQHAQRRRRARRGDRLAGTRWSGRRVRLLVVVAGRRGDLGRRAERHQRLSRARRARRSRAGRRAGRPGGRGQCRRRHRHDLPRVQVRHRHRVEARRRSPTIPMWRARSCRPTTAYATRS